MPRRRDKTDLAFCGDSFVGETKLYVNVRQYTIIDMFRPVLHISEILEWVDKFHKRHRRWPNRNDGPVDGTIDTTWCGIDQALKKGNRGLLRNSSLRRLLHEYRGARHKRMLPRLTIRVILEWADAHRARSDHWPTGLSGQVIGVPGETWLGIDQSLRAGRRGLSGNSSLGDLLAKHRKIRNQTNVPKLRVLLILMWADAYRKRTGSWATSKSGPVLEAPGETWSAINTALVVGGRGMPGAGSLARLLSKHRDVRNPKALP